MNRSNRLRCALLLAAALPALAHAEWRTTIAPAVRYVHLTEYALSGQRLLTESGFLPGIRLGLSEETGPWRFAVRAEIFDKDISYEGRRQNGTPFNTETATTQGRVAIEAAHLISSQLRLLAGLEWDYWHRHIRGHSNVLGLKERYTSWRLLGGVERDFTLPGAGALSVRGVAVFSSPERMRIRFESNVFDEASLKTRSAAGARIGIAYTPASLPDMSIGVELDWLRVPRSASGALRRGGMPAGQVTQPEHVRRSAELFLAYRF